MPGSHSSRGVAASYTRSTRAERRPSAPSVQDTTLASARFSGLCVLCRDELYERLAAEYTALTTDAIHKREENTMTTASPEPPDGDLLPELYESQSATPATLFGTSDPARALDKMAEIAKLLIGVVEQRNLVKRISGNDYLLAPAWAVLAGMTGLAPYTVWTRPTDSGDGYLARVEVRRIADGAVVSAAEQVCTRGEPRWAYANDHALLGMAQTRASSRALRGPLMQVVELAGYKPTPAEEMAHDGVGTLGPASGTVLPEARLPRSRSSKSRPCFSCSSDWTRTPTGWRAVSRLPASPAS